MDEEGLKICRCCYTNASFTVVPATFTKIISFGFAAIFLFKYVRTNFELKQKRGRESKQFLGNVKAVIFVKMKIAKAAVRPSVHEPVLVSPALASKREFFTCILLKKVGAYLCTIKKFLRTCITSRKFSLPYVPF